MRGKATILLFWLVISLIRRAERRGEEREREEDSGMSITGSIYLRSMLWGFFQRKGAQVMNLN